MTTITTTTTLRNRFPMKQEGLMERIVDYLGTSLVNEEGAENVRNYNYHGKDMSKIVKYYQPFWNKCATFIPEHMSPNVVTLMGYFTALSACLSVVYFSQDNPWIFALYGIALFIYQTFDALDGLQGRKVGMYTNATTEVFDHGCDSNVLIMTTIASIYALDLVGKWQSAILLLSTVASFFFMTWENTTTKVMVFRPGFLNPTDSLAMTQLLFLFTSVWPSFWSTSVQSFLPKFLLGYMPALNPTMGELMVYSSLYTAFTAAKISVTEVVDYWKNKHHQNYMASAVVRDFMKSLVVLFPIVLLCAVGTFWLAVGESAALREHPIFCLLMLSVPWAYSILRLILSEITNQDIDISGMAQTQIPLLFPLLATWIPGLASLEVPAMFLCLVVFTPLYMWTAYRVVGDVCSSLGMAHFWTIPPKEEKPKEGSSSGKRKN